MKNRIFSTDSPKAIKADKYGYLNAIHYMAPYTLAGVGNLCPYASAGCKALCLGEHSGAAIYYSSVRASRRAKAVRFMRERHAYMADVVKAINAELRRAKRKGKTLCVRLNGSTDISWESIRDGKGRTLFDLFPTIQFVDYTKNPKRFERPLPANYHLTFSRSETNGGVALALLKRGINVAIVFEKKPGPFLLWDITADQHDYFAVVDGDTHDLRHLDPKGGFVIALSPKGNKAKRDTSGFVVRV